MIKISYHILSIWFCKKFCIFKIDAADKQLKGTRQFLEEQANERELERDEFLKEIESLKLQMKEKDKEKTNYERFNKEVLNDFFFCTRYNSATFVVVTIGNNGKISMYSSKLIYTLSTL